VGYRVGYALDETQPQRIETVKFIFEYYVNRGLSVNDITRKLNERRVPSPTGGKGRWTRSTVYAILTNPVYCGDYCWGKVSRGKHHRLSAADPSGLVRTPGKKRPPQRHAPGDWIRLPDDHPPIVSRELFEAAQVRRVANRRNTSPSRKQGLHRLSGRLVCKHCGGRMYGTANSSNAVYRCGTYMNSGSCAGYTVREDLVLENIAAVLQEVFLRPDNLQRLRDSLQEQGRRVPLADEAAAEAMRQTAAKLEAQIARARGRLAREEDDGVYEDLKRGIREMERQREDALKSLAEVNAAPPVRNVERIISRVRELTQVLRTGDPQLVRLLLEETIDRVELDFRIERKKNNRYFWERGVLHFRCEDSSGTRPGRTQRSGRRPESASSLRAGCHALESGRGRP
jgi:hypothetical protein